MVSVSTHVMFQGQARTALDLYASVFDDFKVTSLKMQDTAAEKVEQAHVRFAGQRFLIIDSPVPHAFDFTPSMSFFVDVDADAFEDAFEALSKDGEVLMPPDNYGFSERFTWFKDYFGVSWQINVPDSGEDA